MEYLLNEDQIMLRDTIRDFAASKIAPHAEQWDEYKTFPREVISELGELGCLGILLPEEYGGSNLDYTSLCVVLEEIARHDGSVALTLSSHNSLGVGHIALAGNEEQKKKYLPKLATGESLAAWALTEPGAGSDAAGMKTNAKRDGDDWILNGSKSFITQGSLADTYVVLAKTDEKLGAKGISAFILERGYEGFTQGKPEDKLGCRASDTAQLAFDNVRIPGANLLGEVNQGFIDTLKILDKGRVLIGAMAVGIARGAIEEATRYAKEREQFGKPIADFQAIQWMLADSYTEWSAAKLLVYRAAQMLDNGEFAKKEASMAKLYASEMANRVTNRAIQIHGGYGYIQEYPVERYFRDAKICEIGEGTSEIQREVISTELLR